MEILKDKEIYGFIKQYINPLQPYDIVRFCGYFVRII